jgi:RNA polymerase sigma factor (sigma-70 family)
VRSLATSFDLADGAVLLLAVNPKDPFRQACHLVLESFAEGSAVTTSSNLEWSENFGSGQVATVASDGEHASPAPVKNPRALEQAAESAALVKGIRAGDEQSVRDLYRLFSQGIRFLICRQLGPEELEDKVHDTFLIVLQAIRSGELRQPRCLRSFIRTVVRRQIANYIDRLRHARRDHPSLEDSAEPTDTTSSPEQIAIRKEQREMMFEVLEELSERDREILVLFYLHEVSPTEICQLMDLTETQFRLIKSRAKQKFGELGKRTMQQKKLRNLKAAKAGASF